MERIQGKGWLIAGVALAVAVPALGLHRTVPAGLAGLVPLPWSGLFVGFLVFFACAGMYFRSHWAATSRLLRRHGRGSMDAGRTLAELAADLDRSGSVLAENLAEVAREPGAPTSELYLDGARAHADRLGQIAARLRAVGDALTRREEP
jgi:hypothetical protein